MSSVCIDLPVAIPSRTPSLSQHNNAGSFAISPKESPRTSQSVALTLSLSALDLAASNLCNPLFQFTAPTTTSPRNSAFASRPPENARRVFNRPRSMSAVRIHNIQKILAQSGVARRKRFMSEEDSAMGGPETCLDDPVATNDRRRCAVADPKCSFAALSNFSLNNTTRRMGNCIGVFAQNNKRHHNKASIRAPGSSIQKPPRRGLPAGIKKGWGWSRALDGRASPSSTSDVSDTPETDGPLLRSDCNEPTECSPLASDDNDIMITDL